MEMNPFTMVNGEPYPLDMRGELDDTAAFKNFKKWVSNFPRTWILLVFFIKNLLLSIVQVGSYWIPSTIWKSTEPYRKFHPWTRWEGTDIRVIFFFLFFCLDFLTYKVHSFSVFMRNIRPAVYFVALCLDMICDPCYFRQAPLWSLQFWTQRDASGQWLLEVVLVSYTLIQ